MNPPPPLYQSQLATWASCGTSCSTNISLFSLSRSLSLVMTILKENQALALILILNLNQILNS